MIQSRVDEPDLQLATIGGDVRVHGQPRPVECNRYRAHRAEPASRYGAAGVQTDEALCNKFVSEEDEKGAAAQRRAYVLAQRG